MKKYLFPFLINFFIFILVGIIGILCYLNPRLFEGKTLSEYSNNFCQNSSNYESIIEMPILLYNDSFWEDIVIKMKGFQIIQYFQKSSLKFTELKDKFYLYICQIYDIIENKEYDFELKKNKLLKIHLIGIKIMKKN